MLIWVLGAVTGSLLDGPSADADAGEDLLAQVGAGVQNLTNGHVWTFVTSALFAGDLVTYLGSTVLLLIAGVLFERRHGSLRTAWLALAVQAVGAGLGVLAIWLASQLDWTWANDLADEFAVGPSMLVAGLLMAFSGGLSALWRRRIRIAVLTVCLVALLYGGQLQDVLRMSTALVGLLAGALFLHTGERQLVGQRSRRETRVLVAVVVAATALGPILVGDHRRGAGSALARSPTSMSGPTPTPTPAPTGTSRTSSCRVMPALLVLVLAAGLRRGRRFAWWAALVFHVAAARCSAPFYAIDYYNWAVDNDLLNEGSAGWPGWCR